jgi:hypothetical protein
MVSQHFFSNLSAIHPVLQMQTLIMLKLRLKFLLHSNADEHHDDGNKNIACHKA